MLFQVSLYVHMYTTKCQSLLAAHTKKDEAYSSCNDKSTLYLIFKCDLAYHLPAQHAQRTQHMNK